MKTQFIIPMAAFFLVATLASLAPAQPTDTVTPISVYVIWEASASTGPHWPNFHSIVRQIGSSLQPGDRIEVISAHAGEPKLRVSQVINSADSQELSDIYAMLQRIKCPLLFNAHVEKAVDMAVKRIKAHSTGEHATPVILMALTSGKLNNRELGALRQAGQLFNRNGWKLHVTGSAHSERDLLIASNQGLLDWVLIEQTDPVAYIRELRESQRITVSKESVPPALAEEKEETAKSTASKTPEWGPRITEPDRPTPVEGERKAGTNESGVTTPRPPAPLPSIVIINPPKLPSETKTALSAASKDDLASTTEEAKPPVRMSEPDTPAPSEEPARAKKSLWARIKSFVTDRWLWLVAGGVAIPLVVLGSFIAEDGRRAKEHREQAKTVRKNNHSQSDGIVIVKVNGQTHHLGKRSQLPVIHIGSGKQNTARVFDKGVSDRHVRLYRKGTDLIIQNIGATPISVNNLPLSPKAKQRLLLPTIVALTENTKLHFSLWRPKESAPARKETNHEHTKELKSAH